MAPKGKLGPVPAGRGIGLWAPENLPSGPFVTNYVILPFDWGIPYGPQPLLQTWTVGPSYNIRTFVPPLPRNQYDWPLTVPLVRDTSMYSWMWTQQRSATVIPDLAHVPLSFDWGVPFGPTPLLQTWAFSSRVIYTAVAVPFNQDDWPLPVQPKPAPPTWTWSYNLNLIGKDRFPPGIKIYDLSPKGYPEPATRTWLVPPSLSMLAPPPPPLTVLMGQALL